MAEAEVTLLLERARSGDSAAMESLFRVVYEELHRLAQLHVRREHDGHTLGATALVHEAYIKLFGQDAVALNDRTHFYSVASRAMRQILVDHARARLAQKRGGGGISVTLGDQVAGAEPDAVNVIALNDALHELAKVSERLGRIVELRYFAGLTEAEIGAILGVSARTVQREWRTARAFLSRELQSGD